MEQLNHSEKNIESYKVQRQYFKHKTVVSQKQIHGSFVEFQNYMLFFPASVRLWNIIRWFYPFIIIKAKILDFNKTKNVNVSENVPPIYAKTFLIGSAWPCIMYIVVITLKSQLNDFIFVTARSSDCQIGQTFTTSEPHNGRAVFRKLIY